jgi:hypothetical protein
MMGTCHAAGGYFPEHDRGDGGMSAGQQNKGRDTKASPGAQDNGTPDWDSLKDGLGDVAGAAAERGRDFVGSARDQAAGFVDERKGAVVSALTDVAKALRESGGAFGDSPGVRTLFAAAADGLEGFAHRVQDQDLGDFYEGAENFFRQRPATASIASFAAGFLLSRIVKASAQSSGQGQRSGGGSSARLPARSNVQARA